MGLALILGCSSPKFEADGGGRGRLAPRPPGPREVSAPQDGPPLESSSEEGELAVQGLGQMALEGWESLLRAGGGGEGTLGRALSRPGFALQASGRRSPESCSKPEKILKRGTYDKVAGLDWAGGGREPCPPRVPPPSWTAVSALGCRQAFLFPRALSQDGWAPRAGRGGAEVCR